LEHLHRALRQRPEKRLAVLLRQDARVEDDDDALVLLCADEAPDALAKFENRFGERILGEGVAAAAFDFFQSRLNQWMIGYGEWEARDDDVAQCSARDIDAAPK